jgi:hypothetical protein|tara:strand:+ start:479 stop:736 length:258 start_codon:yes stop_codon:yes gene_type:complete
MPKQKVINLKEGDAALIVHTNVDGMGSYDLEICYNFSPSSLHPDEMTFYTLLLHGVLYYSMYDPDTLVSAGFEDIKQLQEKVTIH